VIETAQTAALVALLVVLAVQAVRRIPGRLTRWTRHRVGSRVVGVTVGVGLELARTWLAGRGFHLPILGAAVVAGFMAAGEGRLVSRAIAWFLPLYNDLRRSNKP
jgi:hypothetical protein